MRLSTKARYAVMAMVDLAKMQAIQGGAVSLTTLASRQDLPLAYLEQIFLKLRKKGLVKSLRGASGGYNLAKDAAVIKIFDVIAAVDTPLKATQCPADGHKGCQTQGARCLTHDLWEELGFVVQSFLRNVSLADVYQQRLTLSNRVAG